MKITDLPLHGLKLIELKIHGDSRGFFVERFREDIFRAHGILAHFPQNNQSRSAPGVVRGMHFQSDPPQGKTVSVARGAIWDVVVDIRPDSPTFGQHVSMELNDTNGRLLWIPAGFAHGFCVLGDSLADVLYQMDDYYNPKTEGGIRWNDPDLGIQWPIRDPIVSKKDQEHPFFAEYKKNPIPWTKLKRSTEFKAED
jgi:dTDP-4-dehydrorhamnose 3,5-epimerase